MIQHIFLEDCKQNLIEKNELIFLYFFFFEIIDASVPTSSDNKFFFERSFIFNDLIFFFINF